ncbi:MAG: hypothetical protein AAGE80_05125 [Pseudomonadota bacterium]
MRYFLIFLLLSLPAAASERDAFYGTWGTEKQCTRAPVKPGVTVLAEPIEIGEEWLKQGQIWCRLSWFPIQTREGGVFTGAQAQCGEDSVRGYILGMELAEDELMLRWNVQLVNGPLQRCTAP